MVEEEIAKNLIPHVHRKKGRYINLKRNQITPIMYSKKITKNTKGSIKEVHDQQGGDETRNA